MSRVAVLVADYFEESEVMYPVHRLAEDGHEAVLASPGGTPVRGKNGFGSLAVNADANTLDVNRIDGVLVPGGFAPDLLRRYEPILELVRASHRAGKPLGFICHGGWVGISAEIFAHRTVTSVAAIRVDIQNAGAVWVDQPVVVDQNLITARLPVDMGAWMRAFLEQLNNTESSRS